MVTRALWILVCLVCSGVAAYYGQPFMHDNSDAILVLITVMTVFAGFLVAIITILGDPALIPSGTWRTVEARRNSIEARLIRHTWLFVLYLISIALLFVGVLIDNKATPGLVAENTKLWIERAYLFFGVASFLLTFALPWSLRKSQMARIDSEEERRRREHGLPE